MGALDLAIALGAAHLIGDLALQREGWTEWKATSVRGLAAHAGAHGVVLWILLPVWSTRLLAVTVGLTLAHGLIDAWKTRRWWPHQRLSPFAGLALDQFAHLVTLGVALAVAAGPGGSPWFEPWIRLGELVPLDAGGRWIPKTLTLAAAYVLAVPGGSVIVRALLEPYADALPSEDELSLGRVIGYLERLILLTLLLLGEYAAMAVIVAAKSLIRIPSIASPGAAGADAETKETPRPAPASREGVERITTEYFLIGTLGSIAVALFTGIAARWMLSLL